MNGLLMSHLSVAADSMSRSGESCLFHVEEESEWNKRGGAEGRKGQTGGQLEISIETATETYEKKKKTTTTTTKKRKSAKSTRTQESEMFGLKEESVLQQAKQGEPQKVNGIERK
jgi:hypothetical protein